jgi:hypothetical protein
MGFAGNHPVLELQLSKCGGLEDLVERCVVAELQFLEIRDHTLKKQLA